MITVIILFVLSAFLLTCLIIGLIKQFDDCHCLFTGVIGAISCIGFIACCIFCLIINASLNCNSIQIEYNQRLEELNSTKQVIETIQDDYARSVAITQYNTNVREFKEDVLMAQLYLKNPWINWFVCHEYNNFDANAVDYIVSFQ